MDFSSNQPLSASSCH